MKRGNGLKRGKALERGKPLAGGKALERGEVRLKRTSGPKRKAKRPLPASEFELVSIAREAWAVATRRGGCVMCRDAPVSDAVRRIHGADLRIREGHHVLRQEVLKREGHEMLLWDHDNGMCLCHYHHRRHTKAIQRVPWRLVPAKSVRFAERLNLRHILEREYPT